MTEEKRKVKLINRDFQYKLMSKFIIINALILAIFGVIIYIFFKSEIATNLASAHAQYKSVAEMLLPIIITLSLLAIILTSIIIILLVLNASHKIAGPLYRFNGAVKEMTEKNLNPYSGIRTDDQLNELSNSFSKMKEVLANDFQKMKVLSAELSVIVKNPDEKVKADELNQIITSYKLD